jgi:cellulose synthase/poly-beta-1,6-N-acetylglucosamine synthase-like glycosyltransferase
MGVTNLQDICQTPPISSASIFGSEPKITTPRFQIVVPAFNEQESLEHVLQHALEQRYLEHLLIVDDASTDSTPQILERWVRTYGLRAIRLQTNCRKEGAIRVGMEAIRDAGELPPYTILLDSDSMLIGDSSGETIVAQIEKCIDQMQRDGCKALALSIEPVLGTRPSLFEACAFADYTAMQFDQWLVGLQGQLWVINGPGGIFETNRLLPILQDMEPDFETGDLLITVKLMIQCQPISFSTSFCVRTFVPSDLRSYFKQRRRWERGTTKVLWNEMNFYLSMFTRLRLLALSTLIHLSLYIGVIATVGLILIGNLHWSNLPTVLGASALLWFVVSLFKGAAIKLLRKELSLWKYCCFSFANSALWLLVTTPARITGFTEGIFQIFSGVSRPIRQSRKPIQHAWLGSSPTIVWDNALLDERKS